MGYSAQVVEEVIEPAKTREKIILALEMTRGKKENFPERAKPHGTPPT